MDPNQRIPVQKRAISKRNRILEAGEYLFSHKGYYNTSSTAIAEHSGVSIGTFYAYFKDKKEVLLETLKIHNDEIETRLKNYFSKIEPPGADKKPYLVQMINAVLEAHQTLADYHKEIKTLMYADPDITGMMKEYTDRSIMITYKTLQDMKNMIKVKNLKTAAEIITIFIEEIVHYILFDGPKSNEKELVSEAADMLSGYLL